MVGRAFLIAAALCCVSGASHATLAIIGTLQVDDVSPPQLLIYDDNGRRTADGKIRGGVIWLDNAFHGSHIRYDKAYGTGWNARKAAGILTRSSPIIRLMPGFSIDSWDSDWRLPSAGSSPVGQPKDSEFLHLVVDELGNAPGAIVTRNSVFRNLKVHAPDGESGFVGGFYGYWLQQDRETQPGTEIWFNTRKGQQETVPDLFNGGYVVLVRSATVSYDPTAAGASASAPVVNLQEGLTAAAGRSDDIDAYRPPFGYAPAAGRSPTGIVGMGIAGSDDHVYVWYADGTVSSGTSSDLDAYRTPYGYALPPGKTPADIVGMAIAGSNDVVYAWYRDGTVSSGTSSDLDAYASPYGYLVAPGQRPDTIVGMAIAGSNDHVYAWCRDGTVSSGTSSDLDAYRSRYAYTLPLGKTPADIAAMGIAGSDDRVYTWFRPYIR